jgi:hypothetical protein
MAPISAPSAIATRTATIQIYPWPYPRCPGSRSARSLGHGHHVGVRPMIEPTDRSMFRDDDQDHARGHDRHRHALHGDVIEVARASGRVRPTHSRSQARWPSEPGSSGQPRMSTSIAPAPDPLTLLTPGPIIPPRRGQRPGRFRHGRLRVPRNLSHRQPLHGLVQKPEIACTRPAPRIPGAGRDGFALAISSC